VQLTTAWTPPARDLGRRLDSTLPPGGTGSVSRCVQIRLTFVAVLRRLCLTPLVERDIPDAAIPGVTGRVTRFRCGSKSVKLRFL
jgi:hypothetical protein